MRGRLTLLALLLAASAARAQEAAPGLGGLGQFSLTENKQPIEINSAELDFDYKTRKALFRGGVEVVQGDLKIESDTLTVRYAELDGQQKVEEVTAAGNVKITQGLRRATGKQAVFDQKARTLILSGNAVLIDGPNRLTGDTVVVHPDESRMEVRGQNRRVKVLLFPDQTPVAEPTGAPSAVRSPTPAVEKTEAPGGDGR